MADKILSRLGVYDILGVLLSGVCMGASTLALLKLIGVHICFRKIEPLAFLIFSYIVGLVFQELTSLLQRKILNRGNKLLIKAIRSKTNDNLYMEKLEVLEVDKRVTEAIKRKNNCNITDGEKTNIVYNFCKNYMSKTGDTARIDRDQALAAMARSLSLYCFFAPLLLLFSLSPNIDSNLSIWVYIVITCVLLALSVMLYYRFLRFTYRRFIAIYRYYLYNEIWQESENERKGI